ncbi:hypothetical protein ACHAXS_001987 [Conticribra weissflogii]
MMMTGNDKDAAPSSRHASVPTTRPHAPVAKTLNRQQPSQFILDEDRDEDKKIFAESNSDHVDEQKISPSSEASEERLPSSPPPPPVLPPHSPATPSGANASFSSLANATMCSPSLSSFPAAPPTTPYSPYHHIGRGDARDNNSNNKHSDSMPTKALPLPFPTCPPPSPPMPPSTNASIVVDAPHPPLSPTSPPHLQNDPRYQALLTQTLQTTLQREQTRLSELDAHERANYTTLAQYRHALSRERRRSLSLSLQLAEYQLLAKFSSCSLHTDMEIDEEARMNRLRKWMCRKEREMAEEKGRVVMELEREEERMVNGLMGRLEGLRREKEMLEGELRRLGWGGGLGIDGNGGSSKDVVGIAGGVGGVGRSAFGLQTEKRLGRSGQSDEKRLHAQFERMVRVADGKAGRENQFLAERSDEKANASSMLDRQRQGALVSSAEDSFNLDESSLENNKAQSECAAVVRDETIVGQENAEYVDCEVEEKEGERSSNHDDATVEEKEDEDEADQEILEGMQHDSDMEDELEKLLQKKCSK